MGYYSMLTLESYRLRKQGRPLSKIRGTRIWVTQRSAPVWSLHYSPADTTRVITQLYGPKLVRILASHHKGYFNEHSSSQ